MGWAEHVALQGESGGVYRVLLGKSKGKKEEGNWKTQA
jgi:hypothetical protein